jgi:hypothetical protein
LLYSYKILDKFKHLNIKEANTPFDSSIKLNNYYDKTVTQLEYVSSIRSFMYVMHCTILDIAFVIYKLSRYTSMLNKDHWKAIESVFGYLKITIDLGLFYSNFLAMLGDIVMQIGQLVRVIISPHHDEFSHLKETQYLEHLRNKHAYLILPWNLNLLLWLLQVKKHND